MTLLPYCKISNDYLKLRSSIEEYSTNHNGCIYQSGNQPPWGCINTKEAICFGNESLNSYLSKINMNYIIRKF